MIHASMSDKALLEVARKHESSEAIAILAKRWGIRFTDEQLSELGSAYRKASYLSVTAAKALAIAKHRSLQ